MAVEAVAVLVAVVMGRETAVLEAAAVVAAAAWGIAERAEAAVAAAAAWETAVPEAAVVAAAAWGIVERVEAAVAAVAAWEIEARAAAAVAAARLVLPQWGVAIVWFLPQLRVSGPDSIVVEFVYC